MSEKEQQEMVQVIKEVIEDVKKLRETGFCGEEKDPIEEDDE